MKITIVGGGFGGVKAALELAKDSRNHITLVSDRPDFQYYPALYSTATGHNHLESWVPLGRIFAGNDNVQVHIDTITAISPDERTVTGTSGHSYGYDRCILALGTVTTYFGIKGLDTYAYGIKSADEIKRLKQHIYTDLVGNHTLDKRYVIIGAGPTGVELAAALGEYLKRLCGRYGVQHPHIHIDLIEAAPRILPRMSEKAAAKVNRRLNKLGVNILTGKAVESASANDIIVSGDKLDTRTTIWTSGVANHPFYKQNAAHFSLAPNGRVVVNEHLEASKGVYVIGDNAATPFTGLAQTALRDGVFVAKNIHREHDGKKIKRYRAFMPPVVVPVGKRWAVLEWKKIRLYGWLGALVRRAADFIGYSDVLPFGQALGVWKASRVLEDDYFAPVITPRKK